MLIEVDEELYRRGFELRQTRRLFGGSLRAAIFRS
ncbi:hypothetical protein ACVMHW_004917 [Bradyrhizobium diazoefficiens]